ncbi:hypothetical protein [Streptomyces sp. NPDC058614]|uniref:hypothetical protein n=1 Tax=Streptomyces sp. NPDC058614 TaxID=3346557 RepID=UPI003651D2C8
MSTAGPGSAGVAGGALVAEPELPLVRPESASLGDAVRPPPGPLVEAAGPETRTPLPPTVVDAGPEVPLPAAPLDAEGVEGFSSGTNSTSPVGATAGPDAGRCTAT